jgi:hypothetical protein
MDTADGPSFFAPELFQADDDAPPEQDVFDRDAHMKDTKMDDEPLFQSTDEIDDENHVKQELLDTYPPLDGDGDEGVGAGEEDGEGDTEIQDDAYAADDTPAKEISKAAKQRKHPGKSRKVDPDAPPKSSVHSSKNEGQHTDRRYLCYLCNKLFTRRRSVRDHIAKIHNTKTWEPVRSLEIVVDPDSGEPLEPLEETIARGPPPPPPKMPKADRPKKAPKVDEDEDEQHEDNDQEDGEDQEHRSNNLPMATSPHGSSPPATSIVASLKKEPSLAGSRASSTEPFATPAPVTGKKRPAPDDSSKPLSAAARKKGIVKITKSSSNKKPRLSDLEQSPPASRMTFRSPSATPSSHQLKAPPSKLKKQTSAASVHSSPTPSSSRAASRDVSASPSQADSPTSSNDDGEVFCICRKGDNHTWMIACDGGCNEWFHGNCVNIRERDGELIDKYICPTCTKPGLQTTWKRMCRRRDCRKPARVTQTPPSKYCSDACGRKFFVELILRGDPKAQASKNGEYIIEVPKPKKLKKKIKRTKDKSAKAPPLLTNVMDPDSRLATPAYSEDEKTEYETDSSLDADELPNVGGPLRAGEVKALSDRLKTIEEWKALGRKPDPPPRDGDTEMTGTDGVKAPRDVPEYDDLELAKLAGIEAQKSRLNSQNSILAAREQFLELIKTRSATITDEVRKTQPKMKDICGFDPRVAWSDAEFSVWYHQRGGKAIIDAGPNAKIGPPEDLNNEDEAVSKKQPNGTAHTEDADDEDEDSEAYGMPKKGGVCVKNRCPRHRNWAKGQLAEVRFEQDLIRRSLGKLEVEQASLRERAIVRGWERRG